MVRELLGGPAVRGGRAWTGRTAAESTHDRGRRAPGGGGGTGACVEDRLGRLPRDPRCDRTRRALLHGDGPARGIAPRQPEPGEGAVPVLADGDGGAGQRRDVI